MSYSTEGECTERFAPSAYIAPNMNVMSQSMPQSMPPSSSQPYSTLSSLITPSSQQHQPPTINSPKINGNTITILDGLERKTYGLLDLDLDRMYLGKGEYPYIQIASETVTIYTDDHKKGIIYTRSLDSWFSSRFSSRFSTRFSTRFFSIRYLE